MTLPPILDSFLLHCFELNLERIHQGKCRRCGNLIPPCEFLHLDDVEVNAATFRFLCKRDDLVGRHREGKSGWKRKGLLRSRQHVVEVPLIEPELRAGCAAYAVDHAQDSSRVRKTGNRANIVQCTRGSLGMTDCNRPIVLLGKELVQPVE